MNSFTGSMLAVCFGEQLAAAAAEEISPNKHITDYDERWESSNLEHRRRRRRRCPSERSSRVSSSLLKLLLFFCAFLSSFFPQHIYIRFHLPRSAPAAAQFPHFFSALWVYTSRLLIYFAKNPSDETFRFAQLKFVLIAAKEEKNHIYDFSWDFNECVVAAWRVDYDDEKVHSLHSSLDSSLFFREREATTMTFVTFWGFLFSASAEHH